MSSILLGLHIIQAFINEAHDCIRATNYRTEPHDEVDEALRLVLDNRHDRSDIIGELETREDDLCLRIEIVSMQIRLELVHRVLEAVARISEAREEARGH